MFAVAAVVVFYLRELEFRPGRFMNLFLSLDAPDMASVKCINYERVIMDARSCYATVDVLAGKNVLITGASRGIGRELALNYCRMGANVFITARDEKKLKEVRTWV